MDGQASILLMLALTLCIALLGPGLISIEDTRAAKPKPPEETEDISPSD